MEPTTVIKGQLKFKSTNQTAKKPTVELPPKQQVKV